MKTYYEGKRARSYNRTWQAFSEKTLAETCSIIDIARLQSSEASQGYTPRILDVACGTGLLLQQLARLVPHAELYGMDASQDMLAQATLLARDNPRMYFVQGVLAGKTVAELPYKPASFDLITCTNALHYLDDPLAVLQGLIRLLVPHGQLVIEDYARRTFPWRIFEWFIKRVDPQHVRAYTLSEVQMLCEAAGLQIIASKSFSIDLLWKGWAIRTTPSLLAR